MSNWRNSSSRTSRLGSHSELRLAVLEAAALAAAAVADAAPLAAAAAPLAVSVADAAVAESKSAAVTSRLASSGPEIVLRWLKADRVKQYAAHVVVRVCQSLIPIRILVKTYC